MSENARAHHVVPVSTYWAVFFTLLVLTFLTVEAARFDLGHPDVMGMRLPLNVIVALGIAVVKAGLVVLFFMHVKYAERLIWVVIGSALAFLVILIGITASDYMSRGWLGYPGT
jgi:cytochrome c oxidase subunit IV